MNQTNIRLKQAKEKIKNSNSCAQSIGTKQEKTLHQLLKYYLTMDETKHEIKVENRYADVLIDGRIYEIQTQGFDKLRPKLNDFLEKHNVVIVYPIPYIKQIYLITEDGELKYQRKSPKKGTAFHAFVELYKIKKYLSHKHLHLKIIMMNTIEYRDEIIKKRYHSKGYRKNDQDVVEIVEEIDIEKPSDFKKLLNKYQIPDQFTTADLRKILKISVKESSTAVNVLSNLKVIEKIGNKNRYYVYQIIEA